MLVDSINCINPRFNGYLAVQWGLNWDLSFQKMHLSNQSTGIPWTKCCNHPLQRVLVYCILYQCPHLFGRQSFYEVIMFNQTVMTDLCSSKSSIPERWMHLHQHLKQKVIEATPIRLPKKLSESFCICITACEWDKLVNLSTTYNIYIYIKLYQHTTKCCSAEFPFEQITPSTHLRIFGGFWPRGTSFHLTPGIGDHPNWF